MVGLRSLRDLIPLRSYLPGEIRMSLMGWLIALFVLGLVVFALLFVFIPACDKV
jgi:hypothetical protein